MVVCQVRARRRASRRTRTGSPAKMSTATTASNPSARQMRTTTSTPSETSLTTTTRMVRLREVVEVEWCFIASSVLIGIAGLYLDPWLIRKEPKKRKEKKKKKRRKSIDPDSIQSALLASGLGSTRPAFTAPINPPSAPPTGEHATARQSRITALRYSLFRANEWYVSAHS